MIDGPIVKITERARGILAFEEELSRVVDEIEAEKARYARKMEVLTTKRMALEQGIYRLSSN